MLVFVVFLCMLILQCEAGPKNSHLDRSDRIAQVQNSFYHLQRQAKDVIETHHIQGGLSMEKLMHFPTYQKYHVQYKLIVQKMDIIYQLNTAKLSMLQEQIHATKSILLNPKYNNGHYLPEVEQNDKTIQLQWNQNIQHETKLFMTAFQNLLPTVHLTKTSLQAYQKWEKQAKTLLSRSELVHILPVRKECQHLFTTGISLYREMLTFQVKSFTLVEAIDPLVGAITFSKYLSKSLS